MSIILRIVNLFLATHLIGALALDATHFSRVSQRRSAIASGRYTRKAAGQPLFSTAMDPQSPRDLTNRKMSSLLKNLVLATSIAVVPAFGRAEAKVYFDTDVYGDKELKIATVNKLKQKLRNAILADISIAPALLQLAINDSLGYDVKTEEGGPDGSIQFEMDRQENKGLESALGLIQSVKKELQRTNTVSFADIVAFAGAEALETAGCGRFIVQVGRFDSKVANSGSSPVPAWSALSAPSVSESFSSSGVSPEDAALLLGALGELRRVVAETIEAQKNLREEDEDDRPFEPEPFVPTTFGARDAIYGAKMGKGDFGNKYLKLLVKGKDDGDSGLRAALLDDPKVKAAAVKYAGNEALFLKDLPEAYLRMTLLGEAYTTRNS